MERSRKQRKMISQLFVPFTLSLSHILSLLYLFRAMIVSRPPCSLSLSFFPWINISPIESGTMKAMAKTASEALSFFYLFCLCSPLLSKPSFRISLTDCFLRLCWKAELSWRNHIIMLISFIISLWAASSARPWSPLSNPFNWCVSSASYPVSHGGCYNFHCKLAIPLHQPCSLQKALPLTS